MVESISFSRLTRSQLESRLVFDGLVAKKFVKLNLQDRRIAN